MIYIERLDFLFCFTLYTYSEMHILFSVIVLSFSAAWILHILYKQLLQKYFGYLYFRSLSMAVWYALTEVALRFKKISWSLHLKEVSLSFMLLQLCPIN